MSNLADAATSYRSKRMSITLGVNEGSRSRAAEADRLSTPRKIKIAGAVEGEALFDGSDDVIIYTTGDAEGDYRWIKNKPQINGVELVGNKTSEELGLQPAGEYSDTPITNPDVDDIIDNNTLNSGAEDDDDLAMTKDDIDDILNG